MLNSFQKKWLITGVAGFIGSHLLAYLLKKNQYVTGIDNFSTGFAHNLQEALGECSLEQQQRFTFHEGDIRDQQLCLQATQGIDIILHQAALGSVPRSLADPLNTHDVNVKGMLTVLEAARVNGVSVFVYASSSSVYGDSPDLPKKEENIGNLLSPYAVSKFTNELYGAVYSRCYQMKTIGLRYFNVFGPRQNIEGPYAAVIPVWIMALMNDQPIYINGDGSTSRDFTFVDNIVDLNMRAAEQAIHFNSHKIYNGAAGGQMTLNDLLATIKAEFKQVTSPVIYRDFRAGDVVHSFADLSKVHHDLGYSCLYPIQQGLHITVDWFKKKYAPLFEKSISTP